MSYDHGCGATNTITVEFYKWLSDAGRASVDRWLKPIAESAGVVFEDCYRITYDECVVTFYQFERNEEGYFYLDEAIGNPKFKAVEVKR